MTFKSSQVALGLAALLLLLLARSSVDAVSSPRANGLQMTNKFFQELVQVVRPRINATVTQYQFLATGGHCPSISLNAGRWIKGVDIPTSAITVKNLTSTAIELNVGGTQVIGLGDDKAWTSNTEAKYVWEGQLQFKTCFQICFGSSPYSATTDFKASLNFDNLGAKTQAKATVSYANLEHNQWKLNNVSGCVGSQADFDTSFNQGLAPVLASGGPKLITIVQQGLNSILQNSTTSGFDGMKVVDGGSGVLLADKGLLSDFETLPFQTANLSSAPSLKMATVTTATPLPGGTSANPTRCVNSTKACGSAPFGGADAALQFGHCGACLVDVGGEMVATFAFDTTATSGIQSAPPLLGATAALDATVLTKNKVLIPSLSQRRAREIQRQLKGVSLPHEHDRRRPAFLQSAIGGGANTTIYMSLELLSKALATAGTQVAQLLKTVNVDPVSAVPLAGAPENCIMSHQGFHWLSIPETVQVKATNVRHSNATTRITVQLPQLDSLTANGNFSVDCTVHLPLGTPYRNGGTGQFTISQNTAAGFEFELEVSESGTLTVTSMPTPQFTATVAYPADQELLLFNEYVQELFVSSIGGAVSSQTHELLLKNTTKEWLAPLQELVDIVAGPHTMNSASPFNATSLKFESLHAPATVNQSLDSLIPQAAISAESDAAFVSRVSMIVPPFPVSMCHNSSDRCSALASLPAPLSLGVQMRSCTSCLEVREGVVLLSVQFDTAFVSNRGQGTLRSRGVVEKKKDVRFQGGHRQAIGQRKRLNQETDQRRRLNRAFSSRRSGSGAVSGVSRRAFVTHQLAAATQRETILYLGTATLTQATTRANADVTSLLQGFTHAGSTERAVPFLDQCTVTHDHLSWQKVPSIQATLIHMRPSTAFPLTEVIAHVELSNLPRQLKSNTATWSSGCEFNVDLPMTFQQARNGTAQTTIDFVDETFAIEVAISTATGVGATMRSVEAVSHNLTAFSLSSTYSYDQGDSFAFDPYFSHYWHETLLQEMRSEFHATMLETAGGAIAQQLVDFLDSTTQSGTTCNASTFNSTHLVLQTGPMCGSELPGPQGPLGASAVLYTVDAGPLPNSTLVTPQQIPTQTLPECTAAVAVNGTGSSTVISKCGTTGVHFNGHLIINTLGQLALP